MIDSETENYMLAWAPVIPGTLQGTKGSTPISDDGEGNLVGISGTIDYATGMITFTSSTDEEIEMSYEYDNMTSPVQAPEMNLKIESTPIIAKSRKLKALYSLDRKSRPLRRSARSSCGS